MSDSSDLIKFWTWRDNVHQRLISTHAEDEEHAAAFVSRANELKEEVEFIAKNGLNEGAVEVYPKNKQPIESLVLKVCRENEWHVAHFEKTPVGLDDVFWELTK